jgi:hypothetical protein
MAIEPHPIEHVGNRTIDKVKITEDVPGGTVTTYVYDVTCDTCDTSIDQTTQLDDARESAQSEPCPTCDL